MKKFEANAIGDMLAIELHNNISLYIQKRGINNNKNSKK